MAARRRSTTIGVVLAILAAVVGLAAPPAGAQPSFGSVSGTLSVVDSGGFPVEFSGTVQVQVFDSGSWLQWATEGVDDGNPSYTFASVPVAPARVCANLGVPDFTDFFVFQCTDGSDAVVVGQNTVIDLLVEEGPPTPDTDWFACEPASSSTGLTNAGFETGDFTGWTIGDTTDGVAVVGADAFTSPWEGNHMARLATPRASSGDLQEPGANTICQDFVVTEAVERIAFNIFTYDYTGFDRFLLDLRVVDPDTGEVLSSFDNGAWGSGTELKTSGWRGAEFNLAGHVGETVRLLLSAGGTSDSLFGFWAYIDSAADAFPEPISVFAGVEAPGASVMTDPFTGLVTVAMPIGQAGSDPISVSFSAVCDGGAAPESVTLLLGGAQFAATPVAAGSSTYVAVIPAGAVEAGVLTSQVTCPDESPVITTLGEIVLYDPSGYLTNATTGNPIEGAEVTLFKVPGWSPRTSSEQNEDPDTCETNESKAPGAPWAQPAPVELGVEVNPLSPEIDPNVNPFISNEDGYYGWDVAEGCWYISVEAEGYESKVSPVVGVPSEVTDLDLELEPLFDIPGAPQQVQAIAGVTTAVATWVAPDDDGGAPITGYTVTANPGGATVTVDGDVRSARVTGLLNASSYQLSVVATNEAGDSFSAQTPPFTTGFTDVAPTHPFFGDIAWMADTGITTGFPDRTYRPAGDVSRQAMAAFLWRLAGEPTPSASAPTFSDVPASSPFFTAISWMAEEEISTGYPDGTFRPGANISRQAMAAFLWRMAGEPTPSGAAPSFGDVPVSSPFFTAISWMAEESITTGFTDGTFRPVAPVTRQAMAAFMRRYSENVVS